MQEGKETPSKSVQEGNEPLRKEDKGMDDALQGVEAQVPQSDVRDLYTDDDEAARWSSDEDERAVEAPCDDNLVQTKTGFAIFMYDGIKLLAKDALQATWLIEFRPFEPKVSALNSNGVSEELAGMIRKSIEPGQKLAVEDKVYQEVIQNNMVSVQPFPCLLNFMNHFEDLLFYFQKISCLCDDTVEELMWGLKLQMPYILPAEKSMLDEIECFPMSKGMKQLLNTHSFILEPKDMKVTRHIINLAAVVRGCDLVVNNHGYSLRSAAEHLKRISHIDTQGWDLLKLAAALKMICYPKEQIAEAPLVNCNILLMSMHFDGSLFHQLHKTNEPGILSMDMHPSKDVVATGGIDTNAVFFDRPSGQIVCTLSGHSEKITTLKFVNEDGLFITGSADKTVRIWHGSEYGNYSCRHIIKDHSAEDVDAFEQGGYTSASFHPHGPLLGIGTATAFVKIWDMKTKSNVANLKGHVGPVSAMSFSENGYLLATAARDGVQLWDIRKLANLWTISPYDSGTATNTVEFDSSGSYLGIGGSDARIYKADKAEWNIIKTLPDLSGTGKVTSLKVGADTKDIAVGSMDCNLRIFGLPEDEQMQV
ncbi:hypothetical protein HU200_040622 [Digitaria exilis]|uniref:Pre-mRNA-processing factor 19 n=1 Tax=Digitaria exilis TaxID=1010633 RepID=A0A835EK59_9POAL|nr:hypothetical protein HU200_040622 [Digitaria exilis]